MSARRATLIAVAVLACAPALGGAPDDPRPVYVQLVSSYEDHVNHELAEQRLARTLPLLARLRRDFPQAHVSCLYQLTGLTATALQERRSNGSYDAVLRAVREGSIEIGYDGLEEPTFLARPRPDFRLATNAEERWTERNRAIGWFLTEGKQRVTGEPDATNSGGVKRVIEVFGAPVSVWGASLELGGDAELVHQLRRLGVEALLPGTPARDSYPARNLHGFRGNAAMLGALASPERDTAPEVFWFDHALRVSDLTVEGTGLVNAHKGPDAVRGVISKLDRARPHVIRVRLGEAGLYAKTGFGRRNYLTPLEYAFDNPKDERLPPDAVLTPEEIDAGYAREEAVLRWLVEEFFPENPGSRFVSAADLRAMAGPGEGFTVSGVELTRAVSEFVKRWDELGSDPPPYARAGGRYLSLADVFGLLAGALEGRQRTGAVPREIRVLRVLGPLEIGEDGEQPRQPVAVGAVAKAAAELLPRLADDAWRPIPSNIVPSRIAIAGVTVSAAQFLRLMADALLAPAPDTMLPVRPVSAMSSLGMAIPRSRPLRDCGGTWTAKPAVLDVRGES
jgi:hypothetical protein